MVNVIRATEDKLERHEYREKGLGETIKRGLISIDRRIKQWDHIRGTISRLDERLATVETILIQKDERDQGIRTYEAIEDLKKNLLPQIVEELKKEILTGVCSNFFKFFQTHSSFFCFSFPACRAGQKHQNPTPDHPTKTRNNQTRPGQHKAEHQQKS